MRRLIILAVTTAATISVIITGPALAQNSDSPVARPAGTKTKFKTAASGTITVKVTNWRDADLVELQVVESGAANWKKVLVH